MVSAWVRDRLAVASSCRRRKRGPALCSDDESLELPLVWSSWLTDDTVERDTANVLRHNFDTDKHWTFFVKITAITTTFSKYLKFHLTPSYLSSTTTTTHRGCTWRKKCFPLYNLPPKMAAAFQGLITNSGLMAAGMSYSYSSQKQTTSLYVNIWRHWNGGESRLNSYVSQFKTCN